MRPVSLIGAASGWGAGFRATEAGPTALRELGLADWLTQAGIPAEWRAMVAPERPWHDAPALAPDVVFGLVARHAAALAAATAAASTAGCLPVVIGGDHAIAMGSWGGVARGLRATAGADAALGLVWFDAHLDAHTRATTPSMNPHGMSAAVLLGHGEPEFLAVGGHAVRPEHLCYIGTRSYEAGEIALLRRLGVRIITMDEVRRRGLPAALAEALAVATTGTAAFGLTIDLDGFDPADAPGIGLRTENGFRRDEMVAALAGLGRRPDCAAIEIVEYIPEFDADRRTAHLVRDLLIALLAPATPGRRRRKTVSRLIPA